MPSNENNDIKKELKKKKDSKKQSDLDYWIDYYSKETGYPKDDKRVLDMVFEMYLDRTRNEESLFVFLLFIIFGLGAYAGIYLIYKLLPYALV